MSWIAHGNYKWWLVKSQVKRNGGHSLWDVRAVTEQDQIETKTNVHFISVYYELNFDNVCLYDTLDYVICENTSHTSAYYNIVMWLQVWESSMNRKNLPWNVMLFALWSNSTERQFKCLILPGPQSGVNSEPIFNKLEACLPTQEPCLMWSIVERARHRVE